MPLSTAEVDPDVAQKIADLPRVVVETCAAMVGADARPPKLLAVRYGVTLWTIYKRREQFERATGRRLPRLTRVGRPPAKPLPACSPA